MILTFGKRPGSSNDVVVLCDTYDGHKDPHGYDYGLTAESTDSVRIATDPVWADYLIRQGHARVVNERSEPLTLRASAYGPRYDVEVDPQWMRYYVVRAADNMPLDLDKTFAEQGLTDHRIRVHMSCTLSVAQEE